MATYRHLLASDPHLTKPVAAIESLIALLNTTPATTVFETLESVKAQSDRLKASVANPVPLSAGTDLFLQYLISSLRQQDDSFDSVRQHLLANGRLFAARANAARDGIADAGWRFITEGKCILTHGASRSVISILARAVTEIGAGKFKVIYVREETRADESDRVVGELRGMGIPVAEIGEAAVAHVMGLLRQINMVIVGAEAVSSNGGIISRLGTLQIAELAMASKPKVPFYVAVETHKFARKFVAGQNDLGFVQHVLDFSSEAKSKNPDDAVDFTVSAQTPFRDGIETNVYPSPPA